MNLSQHTLRSYDQQLERLTQLILEMGGEVRKMIIEAKKTFRSRDEGRVAEAKSADKIINELDQRIEDEAVTVIALQSPMAIDLRFVISVLKITTMLERAGDLAKNTIKRTIKMGDFAPEPITQKLERMADVAAEMLDLALESFDQKDNEKAASVWKRDEEIDELYKEDRKSVV